MLCQINAESVFVRGFVCLAPINKALLESQNIPEYSALSAHFFYIIHKYVFMCVAVAA